MPTQNSACTLTSVISGKFSRLLQALEMQRVRALRDINVAKTQALEQAQQEKQRLQGHLEAVSLCDRRIHHLLEHLDDWTFLQVPDLREAGRGAVGSGLSVVNLLFSVPLQHQLGLFARPDLGSRLSGQHERQQLGCE